MGDFGLKHIYLICDLKNDLLNDIGLFICFSFIQNYVHLIMLGLDVVIMWGSHFGHNSHQAAMIILVILYLCMCLYINIVL